MTSKTDEGLAVSLLSEDSCRRQEASRRRPDQGKDRDGENVKRLKCEFQQYFVAQVERCSASNRCAKPAVRLSVA